VGCFSELRAAIVLGLSSTRRNKLQAMNMYTRRINACFVPSMNAFTLCRKLSTAVAVCKRPVPVDGLHSVFVSLAIQSITYGFCGCESENSSISRDISHPLRSVHHFVTSSVRLGHCSGIASVWGISWFGGPSGLSGANISNTLFYTQEVSMKLSRSYYKADCPQLLH